MIRQWETALLAGLTISLLVGCRPTMLPPPKVKEPKLPVDQAELQQGIGPFLPAGARLIIPIRPQTNSAVWPADFNGDGTPDGAIAFYKKVDTNMELGVLMLEKSGDQWRLRDQLTEIGRDFDYALFTDISGDRVPELLLGCSGAAKGVTTGMNKDLTVYTAQQGRFVGGKRVPYVDMATGDLNGDRKLDIAVMARSESQGQTTLVSIYDYFEGGVKETAQFELDGYPMSMAIGGASTEKQGLFVDLGVGAHSAKTVLVSPENGLWHRIFDDVRAPTFKATALPSSDVNGDGVIEIGKQVAPPGTEKLAMAQIPWYEEWFQWDGKDGLLPIMLSYDDYLDRYRLVLPSAWREKVTVERKDSSGVRLVDFFYISSAKERLAPLLTICAVAKGSWTAEEQGYETNGQRYVMLGENGDKVIVALLPKETSLLSSAQLEEYRRLALNEGQLKAGFTILPR